MALHGSDIALLKVNMSDLKARPALREKLRALEGWVPTCTLPELRALPPGSFGHAYGAFLDKHGLSPLLLTDAVGPEIRARDAYGNRYAGTHDILHVLTGFGPDHMREMGVLALI